MKKISNNSWENIHDNGLWPDSEFPSIRAQSFWRYHLSKLSGKQFLDVGCGSGANLMFFAQKGLNVYGVDISEKAIQTCKNLFYEKNLSGNLYVCDAKNLKFESNKFDAVLSDGVIYYGGEEFFSAAIKEIHRVLKPSGIVRFYIKNSFDRKAIQSNLQNKYDFKVNESGSWENGLVLFMPTKDYLIEEYLSKYFDDVRIGIETFNYVDTEKLNSFFVVTASKKK